MSNITQAVTQNLNEKVVCLGCYALSFVWLFVYRFSWPEHHFKLRHNTLMVLTSLSFTIENICVPSEFSHHVWLLLNWLLVCLLVPWQSFDFYVLPIHLLLVNWLVQDTSISRLTREIEQLKKDVRNRDVQIATLTSKMSRVKSSAQDDSEETARDKELVGLRLVSFE